MKRKIIFTLLLLTASVCLLASNIYKVDYSFLPKDSIATQSIKKDSLATISQTAATLLDSDGNVVDTSVVKLPNTYAWRVDPRFGSRTITPMDTVRENFHRSTLVEGQGIAMTYLGNIGGAVQSKEYFARKDVSQFPFMDVYEAWRRTPEKQLFLNTKQPYSNVQYQAGGGKEVAENRFKAELSSNFGKRLNVGFNFDYIYARGYYKSQFNKQTSYDVNASYIGDKYKMHLFMGNNNLVVSDNGGITDDRFITNPDAEGLEYKNVGGNSLQIPVHYETGLKNKLRGRHVFLSNSYDLGRDRELIQVDDTTSTWRKKKNYVAPASVILTTHYTDQRRKLTSFDDREVISEFDKTYISNRAVDTQGNPTPFYTGPINDYMSHYVLKNTLAFRMNEGFKSWTKFGLTAFIEHEYRKFLLPSYDMKMTSNITNESVIFVGGALSKNRGRHIRYNANFTKAINTNDLELAGDISTTFNLFKKEFSLKAYGYIKNDVANFFQNNFVSRNWAFKNDFKDVKRVYGGGEIVFPKFSFSETKVSGGYENLSNPIYYGADRRIAQSSKSVNILALKLDQKFQAGIFHLDFSALLQKSTEEEIVPLPLWAVYGNVYLQTKVSKVLTVQLGADSYMHAKYYIPGYDPLQVQFYNQREAGGKIGHFPYTNVYVNLHLKYTRFFIMMYNVAEGFGSKQSFSALHHPVNPMMLKWGMSWKFNN